MSQYPKAQGNGPLVPVFEDVWACEGLCPMNMMGCCVQYIKRTMTVVRHGKELCIINSLRLDDATERSLSQLGTVKHVVALGFMHGIDDPYYVNKFSARLWGPPGASHSRGLRFTDTLEDGRPGPFPDLSAYILRTVKPSAWEACLLLDRSSQGGPNVLICADVMHNSAAPGPGDLPLSTLRDSLFVGIMRWLMGFKGRAAVTPPKFFKTASPNGKPGPMGEDFFQLFQLDWDALVTAHGTPIVAGAKAVAAAAHVGQFGELLLSSS